MLTAFVARPSRNISACQLTHVARIPIILDRIRAQHAEYCRLLTELGANVLILEPNEDFPDSVFVEDTAVVLDEVAILCSMGTESRRGESKSIACVLRGYRRMESIKLPASIEGGDVLKVGNKLLVGESTRTNLEGIKALAGIAGNYGYETISIPVHGSLHLKTACTALPDGRLLINPEWLDARALSGFALLPVPKTEPWAANLLLVRDTVCASAANADTIELIQHQGFKVHPIDISEFAKAEGGLTCLSLLIETTS